MGSLQKHKSKIGKKLPPPLSLEERLKVIANLIVDRIVEDQVSGRLALKPK